MNCEQSSQLISRRLDEELSASEQASLREHLVQCPACQNLEREQRRLHEGVRAIPSPPLPADYSARLREEVWRKVNRDGARRVSVSFRVLAIAAMLLLSVAVMLLALRVNDRQSEVRRLMTTLEAVRSSAGGFTLPGLLHVRPAAAEDVKEQVTAFASVQDYLGGAMRWMAVEGNQVEIGMSGAGAANAAAPNGPKQVVVVRLQYVELNRGGKNRTLSNPQFTLLSGEEASVRLAPRGGSADGLYRYRVKAARESAGRVRANISFAHEKTGEASREDAPDLAITTEVIVPEGSPVLVGASGDASCRRELYLWATVPPAAPANRNGSMGGSHL